MLLLLIIPREGIKTLKVMLHETIFNDDFNATDCCVKNRYRATWPPGFLNATFRCGKMLQVFESDSKTYNNVVELVRVTPSSSLTFIT